MTIEKHISLNIQAPYSTLGSKSKATEEVWLVCHGYGQLSRNFIRRFDVFDPVKHFVIAPQGLSKFYLDTPDRKVGATWMTREDRLTDIDNYLRLIDLIFDSETQGLDMAQVKINLLGFSQGVTTLMRWAIHRKLPFDRLFLWAGTEPAETESEDLHFISEKAEIRLILGDEDQFLTKERFPHIHKKLEDLFGRSIPVTWFAGKHVLKREVLAQLV